MSGMDRLTGKPLSGAAHIVQSIRTILTTPIGTRVMRRDFGSEIPRLLDGPINTHTQALIRAASAGAIARWEPRVKVTRVTLTEASAPDAASGRMTVRIEARRIDLPTNPALSLAVPF